MVRYIEFVVSRLFGTGVDTFVLWVCSTFIFDTYFGDYIVSPIISFEFAVMSNFICSYCWIWKSRIDNRCAGDFWRRFAVFNVSSALGLFNYLLAETVVFGKKALFAKQRTRTQQTSLQQTSSQQTSRQGTSRRGQD